MIRHGYTHLHRVVREGDINKVQELLSSANVNEKTSITGMTPLHIAAAYGHEEVAELLLEKQVDKEALDILGRTPLHGRQRTIDIEW